MGGARGSFRVAAPGLLRLPDPVSWGDTLLNRVERNEMVTQHLPLVGYLVSDLCSKASHLSRDDLASAGAIALITSADSFDPDLGVPFGAFARRRILGAFADEMRASDWATRSARRRIKETMSVQETLAAALGRTPSVDELILTLEREVIKDLALTSSMSGKFTRNGLEFDDQNLIYDSDGSAIIGSRYADEFNSYFRLRSPVLAKRDFLQWDMGFRKVQARRWQASGTYTYIRSVGSSPNALSGSFAIDPQTQYNYGRMVQTDIAHSIKGYWSWDLPTDPWKQSIGGTIVYESGLPLERFYFADNPYPSGSYSQRIRPRGVYTRFPGWWEVSLKFVQDFDVRKGTLKIDVEFANVFNNRAPQNFYATFYTENRLFTSYRQDPFRFQIGLRYQF